MTSTTWLRISYRTGAVADGIVAIAMLAQAFLGWRSLLSDHVPGMPYRYAMALAGSLMLGWTLLLLWADRDPVARRDVLILTDIAILGLMAAGVLAASSGFLSIGTVLPVLAFQLGLIVLFTASWAASRRTNVTPA